MKIKKNLQFIFSLIILLLSCRTAKVTGKNLNKLIIGKWNFVGATDSSGVKYTFRRGGHDYKIVTADIEFKSDMTYKKDYGKNKITICYWKIENDSIFQFGGQLDSLSYDKQFEDLTQVIRKVNANNLILEMRPNLYFNYKRNVPK